MPRVYAQDAPPLLLRHPLVTLGRSSSTAHGDYSHGAQRLSCAVDCLVFQPLHSGFLPLVSIVVPVFGLTDNILTIL